jgi:DNA (cytosine-5)-methyltransferase 1
MKRRVISLFSGVGGLDFGFEAAGFETSVGLDLDQQACDVLGDNREWPIICDDLGRVSTKSLLDTAGLRRRDAAVLIGGPPCQPFSKSGYWVNGDAARLRDPRAATLTGYLRVLKEALPDAFLLENVPGLAFSGKSDGLNYLRSEIAEINERAGVNYTVSVACLNAADFGVPQIRQRVFVIGHRDGRVFKFPKATHEEATTSSGRLQLYRTSWDALGDLPEHSNDPELKPAGKWAELLPSIPEGRNYLWHTSRGEGLPLFGWRRRYWNFLLKLSRGLPAWTLQAQPGPATGPFHWANRYLSARELMRLQTFPENVELDCSRRDAQRLVGNAVPSALAEILAKEMLGQFFGEFVRPEITLLPQPRMRSEMSYPAAPVPARYLDLIGEHSPHPGTGKGHRAIAWSEQTVASE